MTSFQLRSTDCRGLLARWHGHDVVVLENRHIRIALSLSRGAEFLELRDKLTDQDLLWHGQPDLVRNTGGIPTVHRAEGNFLDHFAGGWQEIFPSGGDPATYRGASFGQHGEVALLPWTATVLRDTPEQIQVLFRVECRRMPIRLERIVTIDHDDPGIRLNETAINHSDIELPVMWGHHISIGGPWAKSGNQLSAPEQTGVEVPLYDWPGYRWQAGQYTWPHIKTADGNLDDVRFLPDSDHTEGHLILGPLSHGKIRLTAPSLHRTVSFTWPASDYPYAWCWFVYHGHPDWPLWGRHRLLTIEPFTSPLVPLDTAASRGQARLIPAKGTITSELAVTFSSANQEDTA